MRENITIESNKLLFTEGKDDAALFIKFLGDLGINDVQVEGVNGNTKFMEALGGIFNLPRFRNVSSLGIIRDAERHDRNPQHSAKNAYKSISDILRKDDRIKKVIGNRSEPRYMNRWRYNAISVGIFIICKPNFKYGMLEDLCLDSIEGTPEMRCVDRFLRCVRGDSNETNYLDYFKTPSKNKILTYLASQKEAHGSIHVAAEKGIWGIGNPSFNELKNFLEGFRTDQ